MTRFMTAGAAALATSLTLATAAMADTPDLRGIWTASQTTVSPSNAATGAAPRFNQSEWVLEIQTQHDNVFWGPSKWRRNATDNWTMYEATGSLSQDGSGRIGIVESSTEPSIGVNALIDARYEDGKIYADFRSLRTGTTYSTVLERQVN
ncbi:hypothetical protein [Ruegeria sp. R14_0]|uniref:hypothetical protein n=1 Tax=Ruegeria sp. R14_0 TaxID=2821100 RepID=UPI001ADC3876|nr:hypothetical protein [Ruegeria sp. R14_0]MBO9444427.1 hypothetical protein [Ruegeria sp. R14_0]